MVNLSVNINKVALIRNARGGQRPNVLHFADLALSAGRLELLFTQDLTSDI